MMSLFVRRESTTGGSRQGRQTRLRARVSSLATIVAVVCGALAIAAGASASAATQAAPDQPTLSAPSEYVAPNNDGLGITPGKIKHVWLIVLENKSYDATFTGLNNNSYLWQTLPAQGALLQNYYGTGHSSQDNYIALASGQAPQTDTQDDCDNYDAFSGHIDYSGSLTTNPNFGQMVSAAGPNAQPNANGCVYPSEVSTLFNQLDANHISWKLYAQDLGNPDTGSTPHDAGTQYCGADDPTVGPTGSTSSAFTIHGSADATDQYVAYHNPLPFFESVLGSGDCNSTHLDNLLDPNNGLYHDLQHLSTTPTFSEIIPNDCSDGHDAVCKGNNLSGGWSNPTTPNAPVNYTGGLYSTDLFLEHIIPEIEASAAFRDGGLIDVTFDEAYPAFTFSNSFANSTLVEPTASGVIQSTDEAGETLWDRSLNWEPTGPNVPLVQSPTGQQLSAGPGYNENLDRPSTSTATGALVPCTGDGNPAEGQCFLGGGSNTPGARTDSGATATAGSSTVADNSVEITDEGRTVSGNGIPSGAFVGSVTDTPVTATASGLNGGFADTGSFELVSATGAPLTTTGPVSGVTLGAESAATDPLYDAYDATTGGGDSGDVLISPYIKPGTVSTRYYNHYSTLRTIEDLLDVQRASPGLDGEGHLGYAAQPGLAPFGSDVFTNPNGEPVNSPGYSIGSFGNGSAPSIPYRTHGHR
jgi:hypothetical protein